jgi:hypothetical protein
MATEIWSALTVFALLCAGAGLGCYTRPRLPAAHRTRDTVEMMHLMIGMQVTFAALVLGLLTASVKGAYDNATHDRQDYALQLTELDQCLRNYGPGGDAARNLLKSYTAAVIASTWPSEPRPTGVDYPDPSKLPRVGASPVLERLMNRIDLEMRHTKAADAFQGAVLDECLSDYRSVLRARLGVIEAVRASISIPFYRILVFWLVIIFAAFGLVAPRNSLSLLGVILCAVSLSSAIFVISDLSHPYGGLFTISSADMRAALASMMAPPG